MRAWWQGGFRFEPTTPCTLFIARLLSGSFDGIIPDGEPAKLTSLTGKAEKLSVSDRLRAEQRFDFPFAIDVCARLHVKL